MISRTLSFRRLLLRAFGNRQCSSTTNDNLLIDDLGDKGVITLNRPKELNVVSCEMIMNLFPILSNWQNNKNLVVIKGAGNKAFSAGGDLKSDRAMDLHQYFHTYHKTILLIHTYSVPFVALMDGIVMGGGAGLSVFGSFRVATERTIFAMPETKIAFFPNVGSPYFLQRLEGKLGLYLGLTSNYLKGSDVVKAGVATHYCRSAVIPELEKALLQTNSSNEVEKVLDTFSEKDLPQLSLAPVRDSMDHCFSPKTVEEIISRLERDESSWARETSTILKRFSPTSLKVSLRALQLAKEMSLKESLTMEYRLNMNLLCHSKDTFKAIYAFREGRSENLKWEPPTLAEVSEEYVNRFFEIFPGEEPL